MLLVPRMQSRKQLVVIPFVGNNNKSTSSVINSGLVCYESFGLLIGNGSDPFTSVQAKASSKHVQAKENWLATYSNLCLSTQVACALGAI